MNEFNLHPLLEQDCHLITQTSEALILLNKNAEIPWFILVPTGDFRELDELSSERRLEVFALTDKIADILRAKFDAEKINIAALGNMVPQLHIHVIGRRSDDACWPNPVWGHLKSQSEWSPDKITRLTQTLESAIQE